MTSKSQKDALGTRLKEAYERPQTSQSLMPSLPIIVRLDGRGFSKFTKPLQRPYDERFLKLMQKVTESLVKEYNCKIGYTQSDEISLVLFNTYLTPCVFNGKIQKLISTISSYATAIFYTHFKDFFKQTVAEYCQENNLHNLATFDCRIFNVPSISEATNALYWRYLDCTKNSISMVAQSQFTHTALQNKTTTQMLDKLKVEKNIDFFSAYLPEFIYGTFYKKEEVLESSKYVSFTNRPLHTLEHKDREVLFFN